MLKSVNKKEGTIGFIDKVKHMFTSNRRGEDASLRHHDDAQLYQDEDNNLL